jgi:hypothetical protein
VERTHNNPSVSVAELVVPPIPIQAPLGENRMRKKTLVQLWSIVLITSVVICLSPT